MVRTFISIFPLEFVDFKFKSFRAFTSQTPKVISKKKNKKKSIVNPNKGSDSPTSTFRLQCKKLFLTYPRCGLSLETCKNFLFFLLLKNQITEFIFVREKHAPEDAVPNVKTAGVLCEYHVHIYLEVLKAVDIKRATFLDIVVAEGTFHGNYQPARSRASIMEYLVKDVDFSTATAEDLIISDNLRPFYNGNSVDTLDKMLIRLSENGEVGRAMELLKIYAPAEYRKSHMSVERSLRAIFLKTQGFMSK